MVDYRQLIDSALAARTIENFVTFRAQREFEARGHTLRNPPVRLEPEALVEEYLLDDGFSEIGVIEVGALCAKLSGSLEAEPSSEGDRRLTDLCFDALACIRALEAQLAREHTKNGMLRYALMQNAEGGKARENPD